jgi:RNA-directed DNA polymerase
MVMVEFDYKINKKLWQYNNQHFIYTRYADDILISSFKSFDIADIINVINDILKDTPLKINPNKTRYGNIGGRNWNLGLMLNKNNKITVGYQRKHRMKNMVHNFMQDYNRGIIWAKSDCQHLQGEVSYIRHIEPEYVQNYIDNHYPTFYNSIKHALNV